MVVDAAKREREAGRSQEEAEVEAENEAAKCKLDDAASGEKKCGGVYLGGGLQEEGVEGMERVFIAEVEGGTVLEDGERQDRRALTVPRGARENTGQEKATAGKPGSREGREARKAGRQEGRGGRGGAGWEGRKGS